MPTFELIFSYYNHNYFNFISEHLDSWQILTLSKLINYDIYISVSGFKVLPLMIC